MRGESSLQQDGGAHRRAWWSPPRRTIVVATDDDVLLFFGLSITNTEIKAGWGLKDDADIGGGSLRAVGIYLQNSVDLRKSSPEIRLPMTYRAPIADIAGDSRSLLVVLQNGVLLSFSWSAQMLAVPPNEEPSAPPFDKLVSVRSLTILTSPYTSLRLIAVIVSDGTVSLTSSSTEIGIALLSNNALTIHPPPPPDHRSTLSAVTVAFHPCGTSLAVGLANGQVILYSVQGTGVKMIARRASIISPSTLQSYLSPGAWHATVTLSLSEWGYTSEMIGSVGCLEWSPDGNVLAVGYSGTKGLSVWTQSGCRVMSTTRHETSRDSLPPTDIGIVTTLAWLPHGYGLLVTDVEAPNNLYEINFARIPQGHHRIRGDVVASQQIKGQESSEEFPSSLAPSKWNFALTSAKSPGAAANDAFFLQAADRLLVISHHPLESSDAKGRHWNKLDRNGNIGGKEGKAVESRAGMPLELQVHHICSPRSYIQAAFPLLQMSVSVDGCHIAVAGTCGMALYSRLEDRWRLFGDANQEKQIKCHALSWLDPGNCIATVASFKGKASKGDENGRNEAGVSRQSTLIIFPRHHLDLSSALVRHPLPQVPTAIDSLGTSIILINTKPMDQGLDIVVLKFNLAATAEISVTRRLSVVGLGNVLLEATLLAPAASELDPEHCVLLRDGGLLSVLSITNGTEVPISRGVEAYWVPSKSDAMSGSWLEMPLWTYGGGGMTLVFPSLMVNQRDVSLECSSSGTLTTSSNDPELDFDPDVYPVGISLSHLSIVGVMQRTIRAHYSAEPGISLEGPPCTGFYIQPESQPVLPCLLRRLLEQGRSNEAIQLASAHSGDAYNFSRSLEWLLFTALECNEDSNDAGPLLCAAATLVLEFSAVAPEIVVSVARKTDAQLWPALFQAVGPPSVLCEGLTASDVLDTAACALLIVDRMEGSAKARSLALRLVRRSLSSLSSRSSYHLLADLIRFLAPPSEGILTPLGSLQRQGDEEAAQSGSLGADKDMEKPTATGAQTHVGLWSWMWSVVTGTSNDGGNGTSSLGVTGRLHAAASSTDIASKLVDGVDVEDVEDVARAAKEGKHVSMGVSVQAVQAWRAVGKHAWKLVDSGSLRGLSEMQAAFGDLHGGLAALLSTTAGEVVFSLSHVTPSAPAIASALFVVSNEFSGALEGDVQVEGAARELAKALAAARCINIAIALALMLGDFDSITAFERKHPQIWSALVDLIANDVHLCSFTSILTPTS